MTETMTSAMAALTPRPRRSALTRKVNALRWGTVLVLIALWEAICDGPLRNNDFLAPPSRVLTIGVAAIAQPANLLALWQMTSRFLEAFAIVAIVGSVLGLVLGRVHRQIFHGARDVVTVLYALPMVPFYPLFVLWLGLGMRSEVAFGVIHGIIPLVLITMTASAGVETNLIASGRAMGAGRGQRVGLIVLPAVLPEMIGGLKIAASLSLLGVLLGELMISVDGVGTFILAQINNHQAAPLDAMILIVCLGVVVINALLSLIERRASRWR
ncbi:MAG: ABC transporter permease subunit [Acidobacteria bacterium]|nr:ABC transporter permease subunit [Acidobacteriota bacterium]